MLYNFYKCNVILYIFIIVVVSVFIVNTKDFIFIVFGLILQEINTYTVLLSEKMQKVPIIYHCFALPPMINNFTTLFKGTVSQDFRPFFLLKFSMWAPYRVGNLLIRSDCSGQMSDCEQIAQVTHDKRATVNDLLRGLMIKEWMSKSLVFLSESLIRLQKRAIGSKNLNKIVFLRTFLVNYF